jgi:hypothetical protein
VAAVRRAAFTPDESLLDLGLEQASHNSWAGIVSRMESIITQAVQAAEAPRLAGARRVMDRVGATPVVAHRSRSRAPALNVTADPPEA